MAELVFDDANPYDSNAVRVEIHGEKVGHLSRTAAERFRAQSGRAFPGISRFRCRALIRGGWDRGAGDLGHFGVKLDL